MTTIRLPANNWQPRPYQRKLWAYLENGGKRAIEIAHRRWGKDDVALNWAAVSAIQKPATYWHMLPEYAQARKAIWNAVNPHTGKRRIDEAFPHEIRKTTNEHEMFIRLINDATWQVVGSDSYNSLVGTPPYGLVVSEWALADPAMWAYLAPILEENGGWALFITTPRGKNHAHGMVEMAKRDPRWFAEVQTVGDTGFPMERVEAARREYHSIFGIDAGDALIDQEYFCSFEAAILGAVYGAQMKRALKDGRITKVPHDPDLPVHTAWDLGYDDATAIWWWQIANSEIRLIEYYEASGRDIQEYCGEIYGREIVVDGYNADGKPQWHFGPDIEGIEHRKDYKYGTHYVPHDAANKLLAARGRSIFEQMTHDYKLNNVHVVSATSQQNSIEAARAVIDHCWFDEECGGVEAMRQYQFEWDDEKKMFRSKPLHNWASHGADAFEIISQVWRMPREEKQPEKGRMLQEATMNDLWNSQKKRSGRI